MATTPEIARATAIRVPLQAVLAVDHATPATGKAIGITISKNGGAFAVPATPGAFATEIGSGSYYFDLTAADTNTLGPLIVRGVEGTIDQINLAYLVIGVTTTGAAFQENAIGTAPRGAPFITAADIGNRALQRIGAEMMDETLGFTENSKNAQQVAFTYPKVRQAELRRNVWRFATRRVALRPIDTDTMLLQPTLWSESTTFFRGSIVADENNNYYISRIPDNLGNDPQDFPSAWEPYFGPLTVSLYDSTETYFDGELVYTTPGDGTCVIYQSQLSANTDNPATATEWDATTTYSQDQVITYLSIAYLSLIDFNINQTPVSTPTAWTTAFVGGTGSLKWLLIGGTAFPMGAGLTTINFSYPIGAGPFSQSSTLNAYHLPAGFLCAAPIDPKAGATSLMGAPTGLQYLDWLFENDCIVTRDSGVMLLRFVADMSDVTRMDPMFCEGLAARIALEVCEPLTQSTDKLSFVAKEYEKFIGEARTRNAIEVGSAEPPLDDYIVARF